MPRKTSAAGLNSFAVETLRNKHPISRPIDLPVDFCLQVKTRIFGTQFGQLMVPLIDLANHHNNCKHTITTHPTCEPASEDGCIVWKAGSDLAAGDEVCNIYHESMLQDRAVLQYGFLQVSNLRWLLATCIRHQRIAW